MFYSVGKSIGGSRETKGYEGRGGRQGKVGRSGLGGGGGRGLSNPLWDSINSNYENKCRVCQYL